METRILTVTKNKTKVPNKFRPRIRLIGKWLDETGFTKDTLVSIKYIDNCLVLKAEGKGMKIYGNIIKGLLNKGYGLIQVSKESRQKRFTSSMQLCGKWLKDYGFDIGSIAAVQYEYGLIKITPVDITKIAKIV